MLRNPQIVRAFEDDCVRRSPRDHLGNLRIVEAMLDEAIALGVWPPKDPLEGIEVDIRVAKSIHVLGAS